MNELLKTFRIRFGPDQKPLEVQLKANGMRCSDPLIFQTLANAILLLAHHGVLTLEEGSTAYDKLGHRLNADINACIEGRPMTAQTRIRIDKMTYAEMLRQVRYSPAGDPMFLGETGAYFYQIFAEKRNAVSHENRVRISKEIGWKDR